MDAIYIFTNSFPYGSGEPFLEREFPYLLSLKRPLFILPLYKDGKIRPLFTSPEAPVTVTAPLLPFDPKERRKLLFHGLCNGAPLFIKEFFGQRIWRSRFKMWRFFTSWLLLRAMLSKNRRLLNRRLKSTHQGGATLYFYWGDKSVLLLPFLKHKAKTIVRFHGSDLYGFHPLRKRTLPSIDLACPVSQHGANHLRLHYGALTPPVSVLRLGTLDYGLGPEPTFGAPFHIVTCARMVSLKRLPLVWKALRLLYRTQRLPFPVRWTLIGEGPMRRELEAFVADAALSEMLSVDFVGHLPPDAVMKFYSETAVDLFILTSESEGVPVSIMEAFSFGIPAIATAVGGVPELVSRHTGDLLPANPTAKEVSERLLDFMNLSPSERAAKRQAARTLWEAEWNAERNYKAFSIIL